MASGSLAEVTNDVAHVINAVYTRLAMESCPECAEAFRQAMVALHTDPDSPLFVADTANTGMTIVMPDEK